VCRTNDTAELRAGTTGQRKEEISRTQDAGVKYRRSSGKPARQLSVQCLKRVNQPVEVHKIPVKTEYS